MNPNLTTYMSQDAIPWLELHLEHSIRQSLDHRAFSFDYIVFWHYLENTSLFMSEQLAGRLIALFSKDNRRAVPDYDRVLKVS